MTTREPASRPSARHRAALHAAAALLACALSATTPAAAQTSGTTPGAGPASSAGLDLSPARLTLAAQPSAPSANAAPAANQRYGAEGTRWMTIGGGAAPDFEDAVDANLHVAISWFVIDDFEIGAELGGWYHSQEGTDAGSVNLNFLLRWHFVNTGKWTVFADAGIGVLGASDEVPQGGSEFNFTPRVGLGFTRALSEDNATRLMAGLRWHHISNGHIYGDTDNPARDGVMIYAGIVFPF
jgi:hypothetical protein